MECLLTLKAHSIPNASGNNFTFSGSFPRSANNSPTVDDRLRAPSLSGEDRQKSFPESKYKRSGSSARSGMFVYYSIHLYY